MNEMLQKNLFYKYFTNLRTSSVQYFKEHENSYLVILQPSNVFKYATFITTTKLKYLIKLEVVL